MAQRKTTTKKTTRKPRTTSKTTAKSTAKKPIRREVYGIIYIALAILNLLAILNFEGFLLGPLKTVIMFFIGFGIYILPLSLITLGALCFMNFKGNVPLRSICILTLPITLSSFIHSLMHGDNYRLDFNDLSVIIEKSINGEAAGVIGAIIAMIFEAGLSIIGAVIVLLIINVVSLFISFNLTPKGVYKAFISYFDSLGYEETDEEKEYKLSEKEKRKALKEKRAEEIEKAKENKRKALEKYKEENEVKIPKRYQKFNIDVPLDMTEKTSNTKETEKPLEKEEEKPLKVEQWIIDEHEKLVKEDFKKREDILYGRTTEVPNNIDVLEEKIRNFEENMNAPLELEDISEALSLEISSMVLEKESFAQAVENIDEIKIPEILPINDFAPRENFKRNPEPFVITPKEATAEMEDIRREIEEAIKETELFDTKPYEALHEEIIPDELKSTMEYTVLEEADLEKKYAYPPITLLTPKLKGSEVDPTEELKDSSDRLIDTLQSFGVAAEIINIVRGPSITRFEITISKGVKFSKITSLSDDIALSLGAANVRIAPIPDKVAIGIEVPNKATEMVLIREVLDSEEFKKTQSKLSYALGKDITGSPAIGDIAKMPHMLIAGTTGSGKSVCVNSMLVSLLYKANPDEVKFIMIDPKMVELGGYNGIPHLLIPVVTDPKKAAGALNWAVGEMMKRYKSFAECNVKDLVSYNMVMERKIAEGDESASKMPQVVIIIDELADLMMIAAKEVEESICRIAQMARAAGMHLVIATQRPSSDVITGIMKANIPSRVSFAVSSQIESRIILDTTGAEKLIGKGDMLYNPLGASKPQRLQGCFITSTEIEAVVEYVKTIAEPSYNEEVLSHIENHAVKDSGASAKDDVADGDEDPVIEEAIDIIVSTGQASTSFLQRKLKLGYARASRVIDQIEDRGIISGADGSKARQVLITKSQWNEMKIRRMD